MSWNAEWDALWPVGRYARTGGYRRYVWTPEEAECREWFTGAARARGMATETDRNGNLWAWWGDPDAGNALVTGSHLDSVPDGGAYDGPLGVVSAFAAVDGLRARGIEPDRPLAVVAFADEEGARFGIACAGSRLMTGMLDADRARGLRGDDGLTMAEAMTAAGHDPRHVGPEPERVARIGHFIELHVEQGRGLIDLGHPVGVASEIWPHGRWRFTFDGEANHAGTTRLEDRNDPMLPYAQAVIAARGAAHEHGCVATFGRVQVQPNGTNAIPEQVTAWLDARGPVDTDVRRVIEDLADAGAAITEESWTDRTPFDPQLTGQLAQALGGVPVLPSGAGHDAGILSAAGVPTAMLFVRNPTGVSHAPSEFAEDDDCATGVEALTDVLARLAVA